VRKGWVEALRPRVVADAARSGAILLLIGAIVIVLEVTVIPTPHFPEAFEWVPWAVASSLAACALALVLIPERLPILVWPLIPAVPIGMILLMGLGSHDATATSQLVFALPVLFAAYQLKAVVARWIAVEVVIAESILCALVDPRSVVLEDAVGVSLILVGITLTLATARDRLDQALNSVRYDAEHDAVTGLLSRRAFDVDIQQLDDDQPVSLILVDIDDFKTVNDTFGHAVGDQTLRIVAEALSGNSRQTDRAYRLGGDELAVLMSGIAPASALRRAEVIRRAVEAAPTAFAVRRDRGAVTVSLGVASLPAKAPRRSELLRAADAAMYQAKSAGRNRVVAAA
jgi:diguanylate cyclase (GGDEF)-like protein